MKNGERPTRWTERVEPGARSPLRFVTIYRGTTLVAACAAGSLSKLVLVAGCARSSLGRILQYVPPHLRNRIQQGAPVESGGSWADQAEEPRSVYTEFLGPRGEFGAEFSAT